MVHSVTHVPSSCPSYPPGTCHHAVNGDSLATILAVAADIWSLVLV